MKMTLAVIAASLLGFMIMMAAAGMTCNLDNIASGTLPICYPTVR